jgi:RES domain
MKVFRSFKSYYDFQLAVKRTYRYIYNSEVQDFLQTVLETGQSRVEEIEKGNMLWRAQLGNDWRPHYEGSEHIADVPCAFGPKRMKPLQNSAAEGRANPKGIPYLYLSTDMNTAMAEVRPWIGSYVSLAQFKLLRSIRLINCTSNHRGRTKWYYREPSPKKREAVVWKDIDRAFSKPITSDETTADYVPTQIIAELFKADGFDGIAYRSSLGEGHNVTLFDLDSADLLNCTLFEAKKVSFDFSQTDNPYFIDKK